MSRQPLYSDLDLNLVANALTGDVGMRRDTLAVKQAILTVLKLRKFDIPYDATAHAWIEEFLFDPSSVATAAAIRKRIQDALTKLEPRAKYEVEVEARRGDREGLEGYDVRIRYEVIALGVVAVVTEFLQRIR